MFYRHSCTEYKTINRFIIGHSISEILDFKNDLFGNLNLAVYVQKFLFRRMLIQYLVPNVKILI